MADTLPRARYYQNDETCIELSCIGQASSYSHLTFSFTLHPRQECCCWGFLCTMCLSDDQGLAQGTVVAKSVRCFHRRACSCKKRPIHRRRGLSRRTNLSVYAS
ncbi:hypothetical protein Mapa_012701 [Marchantia paleacea]|nr:hypothetical protein Mapa_012701 [Marchantia paleacea]